MKESRGMIWMLGLAVSFVMIGITTYASLDRSILNVRPALLSDPWFLATLCDAYCGFLIFYVWVAYKERTLPRRVVWFVLMMALGNIAAAVYLLKEVWSLPSHAKLPEILLRQEGERSS